MPKYYVSVANSKLIINANNPLEACVLASDKLSLVSVGLCWKVSEIGFAPHNEDYMVDDYSILEELKKRRGKK